MKHVYALGVIALACVLMAVASLALAANVTMDAEETAHCEAQGGCEVVTVAWLKAAMAAAFRAGRAEGVGACLKSTS